eukprot:jgi/Tetstr1/427281/TSEL_001734.t1
MGHGTLAATSKTPRPAATHAIDTLLDLELRDKASSTALRHAGGQQAGGGQIGNIQPSATKGRASVPKLDLASALIPVPPSGTAPTVSSPRKAVSMKLDGDLPPDARPKSRWTNVLTNILPDNSRLAAIRRQQQSAALSLPTPCNLLSRETFQALGIPAVTVSRVYKLLEAYVVGFNGLVRDILSGQPEGNSHELIAMVWQSLLGMAEEHFQAGYSSQLGSATQRMLQQQAELQEQLAHAHVVIAAMEGQNGVMQNAMQLMNTKTYAQRLRNLADLKAEESQAEARQAQAEIQSLRAQVEGMSVLPGKVVGLQHQLRQLTGVEAQQSEKEARIESLLREKGAVEEALRLARQAGEGERVAKAESVRLLENYQAHVEEQQAQLKENQAAIRRLQDSNRDAMASLSKVEEVCQIERAARADAEASLQAEKGQHERTHKALAEQQQRLAVAEDRVVELTAESRDLKEQLAKLEKKLHTSENLSHFRVSATEARLRTQEADKAAVVDTLRKDLEDMTRWKEQWRHKHKDAEQRIDRMKGEAWEKGQEHIEEKRALREQLREEHKEATKEMQAQMAGTESRIAAIVSDYTTQIEERDTTIAKLKEKFHLKNVALLKELTSGQMQRTKLTDQLERKAQELKEAQDLMYMVNDRAERQQASHQARARGAVPRGPVDQSTSKRSASPMLAGDWHHELRLGTPARTFCPLQSDLTRARNAESDARTDLNMLKMDMQSLRAELARKSDTICEMLSQGEADRRKAASAEAAATQLREQLTETAARLESTLEAWQNSQRKMEESAREAEHDRREVRKSLWAMEAKLEEASRGREHALRQLRVVREASEARTRQLEVEAAAAVAASTASAEASKGDLGVQDSAYERKMEESAREAEHDRREVRKSLWAMEAKLEEASRGREHALRQLRVVREASEARTRQLEVEAAAAVAASTASAEASKGDLGVQDSAYEMQMLHKETEARLKAELTDATEQMESYRAQLDEVLEREYELKQEMEEQDEAREHLYSQLLEAKLACGRLEERLAEATGQRGDTAEDAIGEDSRKPELGASAAPLAASTSLGSAPAESEHPPLGRSKTWHAGKAGAAKNKGSRAPAEGAPRGGKEDGGDMEREESWGPSMLKPVGFAAPEPQQPSPDGTAQEKKRMAARAAALQHMTAEETARYKAHALSMRQHQDDGAARGTPAKRQSVRMRAKAVPGASPRYSGAISSRQLPQPKAAPTLRSKKDSTAPDLTLHSAAVRA